MWQTVGCAHDITNKSEMQTILALQMSLACMTNDPALVTSDEKVVKVVIDCQSVGNGLFSCLLSMCGVCLGILSVINDSTHITLINSFSRVSLLVLSDTFVCMYWVIVQYLLS